MRKSKKRTKRRVEKRNEELLLIRVDYLGMGKGRTLFD